MLAGNKTPYFDPWHAQHVVSSLYNRSGEFMRKEAPRPISWGECQDYNASRLMTLLRAKAGLIDPAWKPAADKSRHQLQQRAMDFISPWYDKEYQILQRVNKRGTSPASEPALPLWEARAKAEAQICNFRAGRYKYNGPSLIPRSWGEAAGKFLKQVSRKKQGKEDFLGRFASFWELSYRAAKIKFSQTMAEDDGWFRSVRDKLDRLAKREAFV